MTPSEIIEELSEVNPDALLADGLEAALIGYTVNSVGECASVAVYGAEKCVEVLVERGGTTPEGADEYLSFNTFGAHVGKNGPIYVRVMR